MKHRRGVLVIAALITVALLLVMYHAGAKRRGAGVNDMFVNEMDPRYAGQLEGIKQLEVCIRC